MFWVFGFGTSEAIGVLLICAQAYLIMVLDANSFGLYFCEFELYEGDIEGSASYAVALCGRLTAICYYSNA